MKLKAGAGQAEIIFPEELFPLEGFKGVHDNPWLKVLVMQSDIQAAIISMDIVMLEEHNLEMIREIVSEATGTDKKNVIIHMTHALTTPHPPEARRTPDPEKADEAKLIAIYDEAINNAARAAAIQASDMREANVKVGRSHCTFHTSRNVKGKFGWWTGMNGEGPIDDELIAVSFIDDKNEYIATTVSFGIKPCAIDNTRINEWERLVSADLTGVCCAEVSKVTKAPVLFFMAAAGDQVPFRMAWFSEFKEDGYAHMVDKGVAYGLEASDEFGKKMAGAVLEAIDSEKLSCGADNLSFTDTGFEWPEQRREGPLVYPVDPEKIAPTGRNVKVPLKVVAFGENAFIFTRPEMSCQSGLELKKTSAFANPMLVTMTDGGMKYMPDKLAYERGYWVASNSMVVKGAAEKFVELAAEISKEIVNG